MEMFLLSVIVVLLFIMFIKRTKYSNMTKKLNGISELVSRTSPKAVKHTAELKSLRDMLELTLSQTSVLIDKMENPE